MHLFADAPVERRPDKRPPFDRAIETERDYFELGATLDRLPGATLAWMPGLTDCAAGAVVHRVDPAAILSGGEEWIRGVESRLARVGAPLARIYLESTAAAVDDRLRAAGYTDRIEYIFHHDLPDPAPGLTLRAVAGDADWERKLRLQEAVAIFPDGHANRAIDWIALERRKSGDRMEWFLAEIHGEAVGAIGAFWGDAILRMKNIVIHPDHRRRSVGRTMISQLAALGRERGIFEQCMWAISGEIGELLYRATGARVIGKQVEWSKRL